jgi:hypothetical protein
LEKKSQVVWISNSPWINFPNLLFKFFVWIQIILVLDFKIFWFESMNNSPNSYFWESSNFGLNFKILWTHSNQKPKYLKMTLPIPFLKFGPLLIAARPFSSSFHIRIKWPIQPIWPQLTQFSSSLHLAPDSRASLLPSWVSFPTPATSSTHFLLPPAIPCWGQPPTLQPSCHT